MEADLGFLTFGATVTEPETAYLGDLFPGGVAPQAETSVWSQVSGPALVQFENPTEPLSNVTFVEPGRYVLRIDMANQGNVFGDSISVDVINQPPEVDVGEDFTMTVGETKTFEAFVTDDKIPNLNLQTQWTAVFAPGPVTFGDPTVVGTTITMEDPGTYIFRLEANDGMITTQDFLCVDVTDAVVQPPDPIQVTQDFNVVEDAHINQSWPDHNFGDGPTVEVDASPNYAGLLKFDLSEIPVGADVLSASLHFNVVNPSSDTYEIYALNGPWSEDTVTWNNAPTQRAAVLGELYAPQAEPVSVELNDAAMTEIESWINDPLINWGFVLQDFFNSNGLDFKSKENPDLNDLVYLSLMYEYVP
jgi:hypothetical protein